MKQPDLFYLEAIKVTSKSLVACGSYSLHKIIVKIELFHKIGVNYSKSVFFSLTKDVV